MIKHPAFISSLFDGIKPIGTPVIIKQLIRFGCVGVTAAALHFSAVVLLVQVFAMAPLFANLFGFAAGFQVSYFGNRYFTFNDNMSLHRTAYPKMLFLQLTIFIINEYLFYTFLSMHLPYKLALFLVLAIMPIFTFIASRFWVFSYEKG